MSRPILVMLAACALAGAVHAADQAPVRITVPSDLDEDIYDARAARGGMDATRMAGADFGDTVLGRSVAVDAPNDRDKPIQIPGLDNLWISAGLGLKGVMYVQHDAALISAEIHR